jgi:hypothetical protein
MMHLSVKHLKRAIKIKEKIEKLEVRLRQVLGEIMPKSLFVEKARGAKGRKKVSAAGRAKMATATKARWAKSKAKSKAAKRTNSATARKRISSSGQPQFKII